MTWIFRDGDSKRAKQVTMIYLCVLGLAINGFVNHRNYMPSELAQSIGQIVGLVVALGFFFASMRDRNAKAPYNRYGPVRRSLTVMLVTACIFFLGWVSAYGVMGPITRWTATQSTVYPSVQTILHERRGKGCHYRLEFKATYPIPTTIPCVSKELWQQVKQGDRVSMRIADGVLGIQLIDVLPE